jgi:hypothetical protein
VRNALLPTDEDRDEANDRANRKAGPVAWVMTEESWFAQGGSGIMNYPALEPHADAENRPMLEHIEFVAAATLALRVIDIKCAVA